MSRPTRPGRFERLAWGVFTFVMLLTAWQLAVRWSGTRVLPSPLLVGKGFVQLAKKGLLWQDTLDSLLRVTVGFCAAVIAGVPLGLGMGWYPALAQVLNPTLEIMRPISPIAWVPLAVLLFGVGDRPAVFLIFLGAFFPIVIACASAVNRVPAMYRQAGKNFGLSSLGLLFRVILPASLPQILVGLRLSLGIAWLVVVAAEMVAVHSGLGYLVMDSRNAGQRYDLVIAAMLMIGAIGLVLDTGFRRFERLGALRWGFRRES